MSDKNIKAAVDAAESTNEQDRRAIAIEAMMRHAQNRDGKQTRVGKRPLQSQKRQY